MAGEQWEEWGVLSTAVLLQTALQVGSLGTVCGSAQSRGVRVRGEGPQAVAGVWRGVLYGEVQGRKGLDTVPVRRGGNVHGGELVAYNSPAVVYFG